MFDLNLAEISEILWRGCAAMIEPAAAGREPIDVKVPCCRTKSEECAEYVAADTGVGLVKDWAGGEQRLCGFKGVLDGQQIAVAQDDLESGGFGVGAQHKEAVKPGIGFDLGAVDDKAAALGRLQKAAEALVGDERLIALGELALEPGDEFGACRGVLSGLLRVAADDIASPGDCRLADRQFRLALSGAG